MRRISERKSFTAEFAENAGLVQFRSGQALAPSQLVRAEARISEFFS